MVRVVRLKPRWLRSGPPVAALLWLSLLALVVVACAGEEAPQAPVAAPPPNQDASSDPAPEANADADPNAPQRPVSDGTAGGADAPAQPAAPEPDALEPGEAKPSGLAPAPSAPEPGAAPPAPAESGPRRQLDPDRRCSDCQLVDPAFEPLDGATARFGLLDGAAYRIELPDDWNGTLILWAHGFSGLNEAGTGFDPVLRFGQLETVRLLVASGFAWASSTYQANGYVPAVGVDDLLEVKDLFVAEFGEPDRVYVGGGSMGGATAQLMAQEFPHEIDGALGLCGALGNVWAVDFAASWHTVAAWLLGDFPTRTDADGIVEWASRLGSVDDEGQLVLSPAGEQFAAVMRALSGGDRWAFLDGMADQWQANWELGALFWPAAIANGVQPGSVVQHDSSLAAFDTMDVVYTSDPPGMVDVGALNAEVVRFEAADVHRADPARGVAAGSLGVPLLTVKTTGDLFTPLHLDADYQAAVTAAGDSGNLVMRALRRPGHCNISPAEGFRAVSDLLAWVEEGIRPQGEIFDDDPSDAGVAFTDPFERDDPLAP